MSHERAHDHVHVHHHFDPDAVAAFGRFVRHLAAVSRKLEKLMSVVDDKFAELIEAVEADTAVTSSAVVLIQGQTQMILDLKAAVEAGQQLTPEQAAAFDEAVAASRANTQALADAVAVNTPAE